MHRPHELGAVCTPAHAFCDRQRGDCLRQNVFEQCGGCRAVLGAAKLQPRAFFRGELRQLADGDAATLGKSRRRLRGSTLRIKSIGQRRSAPLHLPVRLMFRQFLNPNGQPSRRRKAVNFAMR